MFIRKATPEDVLAITEIYNDAILHTTATFDTEIKTPENRKQWLLDHTEKYPVLVAVHDGKTIGFASMSRWSDRCAYDDTAEISIYLHPQYRNLGFGSVLLQAIIEAGQKSGLHCVLSRITQGNDQSIYLHKKYGFETVGILREVGRKFGQLLDVTMMQLIYS